MTNININRINAVLNDGQIANIKAHLSQAAGNVPFLTGLTLEERISIPKINVSNKNFTEEALSVLSNNSSIFPVYLNAAQLQNDLTLYRQLDELVTLSRQLTEKLEDTMMLAGSEAYVTALSVYRILGASAEAGLPGTKEIYAQLKERFAGQGGTKSDETPQLT